MRQVHGYPAWVMMMVMGLMGLVLAGCEREPVPGETVPVDPAPPATEAAPVAEEAGAVLPETLPVVDLAALEALITETAERGQVLVIDFWATWCVPCVAMFPDLHGGAEQFGDEVRMVSVTLDDPGEDERKAIQFLAEQKALEDAFLMISDGAKQVELVQGMGERWTDLVVPAILVYDKQGSLAGEFIDADARTDRILARIGELVGGEGEAQARLE